MSHAKDLCSKGVSQVVYMCSLQLAHSGAAAFLLARGPRCVARVGQDGSDHRLELLLIGVGRMEVHGDTKALWALFSLGSLDPGSATNTRRTDEGAMEEPTSCKAVFRKLAIHTDVC